MAASGGPAVTVLGSKMYATWSTPKQMLHAASLVNPGLAGYPGSLYAAWTPDIEGSPIDYSVRS